MTSLILPSGPPGPQGTPGLGVPAGGAAGAVLQKKSATDYDTQWLAKYLDPIHTYNGVTSVATQPPVGDFTVDTAPVLGGTTTISIHETDAAGRSRFNQLTTTMANGDWIMVRWPDGGLWALEIIGSGPGFQGSAPNRWMYATCVCRVVQETAVVGTVATLQMLPGIAAQAPRVIQESRLTANSAALGSAATATGMACTFTPLNGRNYYAHFGLTASISTSLFHTWSCRENSTAGANRGQAILVQSNLTGLWFEATIPLSNLVNGTSVNMLLVVLTNTGTVTIQAASPTNAFFQILERV